MKSILAGQFWNEEVNSPRSLDAVVHALPNEPPPLGMVTGTHLSRSQQLVLLQRMLWIPCTPSYAVDVDNGGGVVLDRVLGSTGGDNWWATLTGRVRAQRLLGKAGLQRPTRTNDDHQSPVSKPKKSWQEQAVRLLDSSLYALCFRSRLQLGPNTSLSGTSELDTLSRFSSSNQGASGDERTPWRGHIALRHQLERHQISMKGSFHECYLDREARYWDVPQALSVDVASQGAPGGLRYRLGVHHSAGVPVECGSEERARKIPLGALPGMRVQAAASLEKVLDIWKGNRSFRLQKSYSLLRSRPHISLSGIVGCLVTASLDPIFGDNSSRSTVRYQSLANSENSVSKTQSNAPLSSDLFASLGLSAQFGLFQRRLFDYTKMGVRLDLGSASTFAQAVTPSKNSDVHERDERGHPTLVLAFQQQLLGPLCARVESRVALDPSNSNEQPRVQETTYGLDYSLEALGAIKLCIWYSPTRLEGMAELRVLER